MFHGIIKVIVSLFQPGEEQQLAKFQELVASTVENPEYEFSQGKKHGVKRHRGYRGHRRGRGGKVQHTLHDDVTDKHN